MIDRLGFDNEKYLEMQSEHIRSRIDQFGGKLYLEFGGKLFDDNHASRVLAWVRTRTAKIRMLHAAEGSSGDRHGRVNAMDLEKKQGPGRPGHHLRAPTSCVSSTCSGASGSRWAASC